MTSKALPAHSKLSASSCERWWNCPGSVKATEKSPNTTSSYAAQGTVAHSLGADCLEKKWDYKKLESFLGIEKAEGEFMILIDEEMIDSVWEYVSVVRSHLRPGAQLIIEKKIQMTEVHELFFATPDAIVIWPFEKVFAFDLKYGAGMKVSAYENKQLLYYILRYFIDEDVPEIEVNIVQPRIGDDHVSSYYCDAEYMQNFRDELAKRAKEAMNPKAKRYAGTWCKKTFCPVFNTCTAASKKAQDLVAKDFADAPVPTGLTMKQLVKVLDNQEFLKAWLGKVVEYAKELAHQGEKIPGYKLVKATGNRVWISEPALRADFEHKFGDKMMEPGKLKSPAKMEKLIGKKPLENYITKPDKGLKLVTSDSKGEPVNLLTAAEDFEEA